MERQYIKYYLEQTGGNYEDIGTIYHSKSKTQCGGGIGSFFGGLYRYLRPIVSSGIDLLKKEALSTGIEGLSAISKGANPKEVFQDRGAQALKNIRRDAMQKLYDMYGSGVRKNAIKRRLNLENSHLPASPPTKRRIIEASNNLRKIKTIKKNKKKLQRVADIFNKNKI